MKESKEVKIIKYFDAKDPFDLIDFKSVDVSFCIHKKPENYVRERSGRGNHFYNPKETLMKEYRRDFLKQMSTEDYNEIQRIIKENNDRYIVNINATYYYPIPKGDSIKVAALKEGGFIDPTIRIDLDNYDKFLLDAMHDVLYDDDKHVVAINSAKKYSLDPRTEITATVTEIKLK